MEKFWMVYLENGNNPTFRHNSVESAAKEAERLTRQTGRPADGRLCSKASRR